MYNYIYIPEGRTKASYALWRLKKSVEQHVECQLAPTPIQINWLGTDYAVVSEAGTGKELGGIRRLFVRN